MNGKKLYDEFKRVGEIYNISMDDFDNLRDVEKLVFEAVAGSTRDTYFMQGIMPTSAEPVAYADPKSFANLKVGVYAREFMWAAPDAGLVPLFANRGPERYVERQAYDALAQERDAARRQLAELKVQQPSAGPVATVVSRIRDQFRVGWLRPENCQVGDLLYTAPPAPAQQDDGELPALPEGWSAGSYRHDFTVYTGDQMREYGHQCRIARQPAQQDAKPLTDGQITAIFETVDNGITGTMEAVIKRIEHHDDGGFTAVIDHWPEQQDANPLTDAEIDAAAKRHGMYRAMTPDDKTCERMITTFARAILAAAEGGAK